jgi:sugar lactone lactonase YvrE
MSRPHALLRAGFPYLKTIGMRRVVDQPVDVVVTDDLRVFVLCRNEGLDTGVVKIARVSWDDENLGDIGALGSGEGRFTWPAAMLLDADQNLVISDEALHRVTVITQDGEYVRHWGEHGHGEGQLDRPSGIAFDPDGNLYVVDTMNHRVQRFTADGKFLAAWGNFGDGPGQFNMPWGIHVDELGDVYVADWRNDRVQRFTADGEFVMAFGGSGSGAGEFRRPSGIAVDADGDIYVADTGNNRVQLFAPDGRYVEQFIGDASLSPSGRKYLLANARPLRLRTMTSVEPQKRLRSPRSVRVDAAGRLFIPDYASFRIQIYQKDAIPLDETQIAEPLRSPTLQVT